jgi:hypothetical protein
MRSKKNVDKWYTETRTAHSKAQFLMEYIGCRPCAILPNKDIFFGGDRRESNVIDVIYNDEALYGLRNQNAKLLPCFSELCSFITHMFNLPGVEFDEGDVEIDTEFLKEAYKVAETTKVEKKYREYNVIEYKIITNQGSWMTFYVTGTVNSAEKTEIEVSSAQELAGILFKLDDILQQDSIDYFEIYFPATDPDLQAIFLELGFNVFGYVPAWKRESDGKLTDCIVFGRSKQPIDPAHYALTKNSKQLDQLLEPFR